MLNLLHKQRPENFTASAGEKMFISRQTHEGIQITCYSVIEATKYVLKEGFWFVLTEHFCQDVLEEYFRCQWVIAQRNDNQTVLQFGSNDNIIRIQRLVINFTGNTRGKYKNKRTTSWIDVDNQPLSKRKK